MREREREREREQLTHSDTNNSLQPIPRQSTDFSLRLPQGWRKTVSEGDRHWIGRSLFTAKKRKLTDKRGGIHCHISCQLINHHQMPTTQSDSFCGCRGGCGKLALDALVVLLPSH